MNGTVRFYINLDRFMNPASVRGLLRTRPTEGIDLRDRFDDQQYEGSMHKLLPLYDELKFRFGRHPEIYFEQDVKVNTAKNRLEGDPDLLGLSELFERATIKLQFKPHECADRRAGFYQLEDDREEYAVTGQWCPKVYPTLDATDSDPAWWEHPIEGLSRFVFEMMQGHIAPSMDFSNEQVIS